MDEVAEIGEERVLALLADGEVEILGLMPYASNATLLTKVTDGDLTSLAVYKPQRGERPLWDFPGGTLCYREYAAWIVDRALGFGLVPPAVLRDGPAGFGALQFFVEPDEDVDLTELPSTHPDELRRMCAFDVVSNNADRKAGHCIVDPRGKLWGVDHGICFHVEPKLRTVIWLFEDEPLPSDVVGGLERFCADDTARRTLSELLDPDEVEMTYRRVARLLSGGRFPAPGAGRNVPWPPW